MRAREEAGAVVGDADVLGEARVVALGQPIPVRLLPPLLHAERGERLDDVRHVHLHQVNRVDAEPHGRAAARVDDALRVAAPRRRCEFGHDRAAVAYPRPQVALRVAAQVVVLDRQAQRRQRRRDE
eukprot:3846532-Prymnesium_polylepis.1